MKEASRPAANIKVYIIISCVYMRWQIQGKVDPKKQLKEPLLLRVLELIFSNLYSHLVQWRSQGVAKGANAPPFSGSLLLSSG